MSQVLTPNAKAKKMSLDKISQLEEELEQDPLNYNKWMKYLEQVVTKDNQEQVRLAFDRYLSYFKFDVCKEHRVIIEEMKGERVKGREEEIEHEHEHEKEKEKEKEKEEKDEVVGMTQISQSLQGIQLPQASTALKGLGKLQRQVYLLHTSILFMTLYEFSIFFWPIMYSIYVLDLTQINLAIQCICSSLLFLFRFIHFLSTFFTEFKQII